MAPISFPLLQKILGVFVEVCAAEEVSLYRAAFLIACSVSTRVGEFTAVAGSNHTRRLEHVDFTKEKNLHSAILSFPTYKASESS